jgi:hypothetical protein
VLDCGQVLKTDLFSFNGNLVNDKADLTWSASKEEQSLDYIIERSYNGTDFPAAGSVKSYENGADVNRYYFMDPVSVNDKVWYRICMKTADNKKKYSSIIQLKKDPLSFDLSNIINPFSNNLVFDVMADRKGKISISLTDMTGRTVMTGKYIVYAGVNNFNLTDIQTIHGGVYTLEVINNDNIIRKRVMKK